MAKDELKDFSDDLLRMAQDIDKGKHVKKFMQKEGNTLKRKTVSEAKRKVKKKTGNLFRGIERGKVFFSANDTLIRVYASTKKDGAPHAHLLNNGHRIVDKSGKEHGFVEGKFFFESALDSFENEHHRNTEEFIDDMLKNHGL